QWQFRIQQYLQHEHYALWEVIEFGDSYVVPASSSSTTTTDTTSDESGKKSGRTVTLTAKDMQKKKNDVKARTTLLLSLPDEHQLRFSKYKAARELWTTILRTFGGNEATKKTKKNLLKQQYGNFKAGGSETLEQSFNRLQVIVGQLQGDLDTMSLDDLYNHLKVYELEVQKKSEPNSQKMAFISSVKHSNGNEDGNTACVSTASTNVPTASASASVATISQDTTCAYIASQSSDKFWKKTWKKISIQGSNVAGFDKSKVECFNCHKMGHFTRECRAPRSQERGRRDNYRQRSKAEEHAPKALMAIDGVGWDWSYMANDEEDHALVADEVAPTEFALMANTSAESKVFDNSLCSKDCLLKASKDLDNLIENQRSDKNKDGLGYSVVPPPHAQLYLSSKKDLSCTGLPECADDTVTDYSRPSPTVESTSGDDQNRNPSVSKTVASPITPKPFIKFVKPKDSQFKSKIGKTKSPKKPPVKYAEQYRKPNKKPNVRGNQRNWNNLKSCQLGPYFVMKKKTCFNCGDFNHLAYDFRKRVKKSFTPKLVVHRPYRPSQRPVRTNMKCARPNRTSFNKQAHSYANRPFHRTSAVRSQYRAPWVPTVNRNFPPVNRKFSTGSSQNNIDDKGYWDSGCSRYMTGNISYLSDYEPFDGGYVSFGQGGCKITRKWTIKTGKLEFENVYFVKDLKYNLFSVSQIYDNKNSVLFTDSECIVLGRDFKLLDDANILLRTPMQHNMYSIDLNNIVPDRDLTCLVSKASADECVLWHRRLGHLNFKTMNKLVRHNLVRGLPTKYFENDHTCTACLKGKQHKASFPRTTLMTMAIRTMASLGT
nr:ribonuclease H-like domain-containing protein [Tanacetum cinerariifolium]